MEDGERQRRGWHEHFVGGPRVNCESVPRLPARAVRLAHDDPRQVPYLFVWRLDGSPVAEVARVAALPGGPAPIRPGEAWVSITRPFPARIGCVHALQLTRHPLPRNGGEGVLLLCPLCQKPRRYLYAWEVVVGRVFSRPWHCRTCAGLRYQSEGTYVPRAWRGLGGYPRPETWDPYVFSSLERATAWLSTSSE